MSSPIFARGLMSDQHMFSVCYAACATSVKPPKELRAKGEGTGDVSGDILGVLKDLNRSFGSGASGHFAMWYLRGNEVWSRLRSSGGESKAFEEWRERCDEKRGQWISSQEQNVRRLSALLDLSDAESDLLLFQLNREAPGFGYVFDVLMRNPHVALMSVSTMLKVPTWELTEMVGPEATLVRSGLLGARDMPFSLESPSMLLQATLTLPAASDAEFIERFVKKLESKPSTASLARLDERDEKVLVKVLGLPIPAGGVHALIYGNKGIDKHDLLARILEREHFESYVVASKDVLGRDLAAWVYIAQRYLITEKPKAVLVVERAEQVLASRSFSILSLMGMGDVSEDDPLASDAGLTGAKLRCIWVTDRGKSLSENNLGRFLFHCEARPGSRADRRERVAAIIEEAGMGEGMGSYLSRYSLLAEQPVRQAVRLADLVCDPEDKEAREETIRRAVAQSQRVLGRDATEDLRDSVTTYNLDMLNLNAKFTPQQIVEALKRKQKGTLLFHGIPGGGKTQFAEYLAVELDKPLLLKRASDILSKWVGDNEQNIAEMFVEAEENGAILFIDESDSFLRDRAMARAEWSVTMVNELLQHLERAEGIVICATNLMDDIDTAAMRRFTFKIEFKALTDAQAWHMLATEAGIDEAAIGEEEVARLQMRLRKIKDLAVGDFATVKRMSLILDEETMSADDWLDQLEQEAKDKMAGLRRAKLGFGHD
jgi:hypothetical protein